MKVKLRSCCLDLMGAQSLLWNLSSLQLYFKSVVTNQGIKMDGNFQMDTQINSVVKASSYQLFNSERLIHTFITTCLVHCNALYVGISQNASSRLQLVHNAAAHHLRGTRKLEHISLVFASLHSLHSLHWLPECFRIHFRMSSACIYISDHLPPWTHWTQLTSNYSRSRKPGWGPEAARLWHEPPLRIRTVPTLSSFLSHLILLLGFFKPRLGVVVPLISFYCVLLYLLMYIILYYILLDKNVLPK